MTIIWKKPPLRPRPIGPQEESAVDFPIAALGPLAAAVELAASIAQTPIAVAANSALAVASLAVQGHANVQTLGPVRPTSLWLVTIARSGERKSTSDELFMKPLVEYEETQRLIYKKDNADFCNQLATWKRNRERSNSEKKSSQQDRNGEQQNSVDVAGPEPTPPLQPGWIVADATYEGLCRMLEVGQPTVGLFSDEGGVLLGGHAMNKENSLKTTSSLNSLWQGGTIRRSRRGDGQVLLPGRRLAVHIMMQPSVAQLLLASPEAVGNGFLSRILICEPESIIGKRKFQDATAARSALEKFYNKITDVLKLALPLGNGSGGLEPRLLGLSNSAKLVLVEYYNKVEALQAPGQRLHQYSSIASKTAEQASRIAAVISLYNDIEIVEIDETHMSFGITLAEYYMNETVRLMSCSVVDQLTKDSRDLLDWLQNGQTKDEIYSQYIQQYGPHSLRNKKRIGEAIKVLVEHGWLLPLKGSTFVDGQNRKEAWELVRTVQD